MASNIKVVLELENRKYLSGLKSAERAGETFGKNTKKSVDDSSRAFDRLKGAVAAIGIGALVKSSVNMASQLANMSAATGIAIDKLGGFRSAMIAAGGTGDRAVDAISDLTKNMGEAANGSTELQKSFFKVGVSMEDMRKLSKEDIFKKTIEGLAAMPDKASRTALAFKLMGESVKGVDINALNKDMNSFGGNTSAFKAAADAQTALAKNLDNLQTALVNVIEPLNKIASAVNISIGAWESVIKVVAAALGSYLIFSKGLKGVTTVMNGLDGTVKKSGGLFALFGNQLKAMGSNVASVFKGIGRAFGTIGGGTSAFFSLSAAAAGALRLLLRFTGVAGIIYAAVEAVNALVKAFTGFDIIDTTITKFKQLYAAAKEYFGIANKLPDTGAGAGRGNAAGQLEDYKKRAAAEEEAAKKKKELEERLAKARAIGNLELAMQADSLKRSLNLSQSQLIFENEMMKLRGTSNEMSDDQLAIEKQLFDIDLARLNAMGDLKNQIAKATLAHSQTLDITSEEYKIQADQIAALQKQLSVIDDIYTQQNQGMRGALEKSLELKTLDEARLTIMEAQAKAAEDNIARQEALGNILNKSSMDLGTVKFEGSQSGLGSLDKQFNQIKENARLAAYEAGKAFSQMFPEDITPEQGYELAEGLKAIAAAHKEIADAQLLNIETSRQWSTGMQEAMADFVESSNNAADQARGYFEKFTSGVEDAFVGFVQTGKLSFKDLANTMIAEFARVQAKKLLAGLMGGGGGGGGSILGSLFGGFFANGGTLGAGKWGIAGENGPEIIKGPAQVLNAQQMAGAGGATNITYNIQAVDASSFKSMVARDPEFIYSVTEQGRRGMPGRRSR